MNSLLVLAPMFGAGIGMAAGYGVTHRNRDRRIHFVDRGDMESELSDLDISVKSAETCVECGDDVGPGDVGAFVKEDGGYRAVCNNPACLDSYDLK